MFMMNYLVFHDKSLQILLIVFILKNNWSAKVVQYLNTSKVMCCL